MWRGYDWSVLSLFVDLQHEVVLVDDEKDESDGGERVLRRMKVIETSEVFEARAPEDGGRIIKAKGPGGIPPAPPEGLGVLKPNVPIVFGHNITTLPKPPPIGGNGNVAPPQSPQKGILTSEYHCPLELSYKHNGADLRFAFSGKDQCSDTEKVAVNNAFWMAYQLVRSAELEMAEWENRAIEDKRYFWQAYQREIDSTLETWFGGAYMPFFEERFAVVLATLKSASFRYRNGFYSIGGLSLGIPVTFNCRPEVEKYTGLHTPVNNIKLGSDWFGWTSSDPNKMDMRRTITIVHEMLHYCRNDFPLLLGDWASVTNIVIIQYFWFGDLTDRHDPDCTTGPDPGKCYRPNNQRLGKWEFGNGPFDNIQKPFIGDTMGYYSPFVGLSSQIGDVLVNGNGNLENPARLVWNFEQQVDGDAKYKMMGNVDNFVCWIWNRWIDHGYCRLDHTAPA